METRVSGGSRRAIVEQFFGDGDHLFALRIGELIELDEKFKVGPLVMFNGLLDGSWRVQWVREILRIGLVGGGMDAQRADQLVRRYCDEVPDYLANSKRAMAVLGAALNGFDEEEPGKSPAAKTPRKSRKTPPAASASPPTTPGQP